MVHQNNRAVNGERTGPRALVNPDYFKKVPGRRLGIQMEQINYLEKSVEKVSQQIVCG